MAEHPTIIKTYGLRAPPVGARYFLQHFPHLQLKGTWAEIAIGLHESQLLDARLINRDVNEMMIHTPDGEDDFWGDYTIEKRWVDGILEMFIRGDCDDACVRTLELFNQAYLPRGGFRLCACKVRAGFRWEQHLVILAKTHEARYLVLDNRTNEAYDYEKAVSAGALKPLALENPNSDKWFRLTPAPMFSLAALTQRMTGDT